MCRFDTHNLMRTVPAHRPRGGLGPDVNVSAPLDALNY